MQEAYRPPRSKCSLCWWGGVPYPVMVGGPHHPDLAGGYPGYPPPSKSGPGGYPGYPHLPDLARVPPHHPDLARVPPIKTWVGYPPPSRPGWGLPPPTIKTWPGYPLTIQTWLGYPQIQTRPGYPPQPSRPGWGTPPPPPSRCGLTYKLKTVPSPILRMRAVKTE